MSRTLEWPSRHLWPSPTWEAPPHAMKLTLWLCQTCPSEQEEARR